MYKDFYLGIIYNSEKLETTWMINNRRINYLLYVHRMKYYTKIIFTMIFFTDIGKYNITLSKKCQDTELHM